MATGRQVACARCGYSLYGLSGSVCPECALPACISLREDVLALRSADVLRSLRRGVLYMLFAVSAVLLVALLAGSGVASAGFAFVMLGLAVVAAMVGWWRFTVRDPVFAARDARLLVWVNRIMASVHTTAFTIGLVFLYVEIMTERIGVLLVMVIVPALAAHWVASLLYIRQIARRIPAKLPGTLAVVLLLLLPLALGSIMFVGSFVPDQYVPYSIIMPGLLVAFPVMYGGLLVWLWSALPRESAGDGLLASADSPPAAH